MGTLETIDCVRDGYSMARFGDGELRLISDNRAIGYQQADGELASGLLRVIQSDDTACKIALPDVFRGMKGRRFESRLFWTYVINANWPKWKKFIRGGRTYADTQSSRFYMNYDDIEFSKEAVKRWKSVWEGKKLTIVEGKSTKLGIGNDLFDNALSIERMLCPAKNAFGAYTEIFETVKAKVQPAKDSLVLLALGPTATVLAYDLAHLGYHAVDKGHIDIEYMWMLMGAKKKVSVTGKAVNELKGKDNASTIMHDTEYEKQIIAEIS